jgi:hypothetical protein
MKWRSGINIEITAKNMSGKMNIMMMRRRRRFGIVGRCLFIGDEGRILSGQEFLFHLKIIKLIGFN